MKIAITILYFIFGFLFNAVEPSDDIIAGLKQGKSIEIVKYFDEKISLKILNQEDVLSKSQTEANLNFFLEKHPVKSFSSSHVTSASNGAQYITGILETTNGKFKVSILLRRNLIAQFRIENDND